MEKNKKSLKTKIILITILGIIICASIFVALNFKKWIAGPKADVEVSVTDLYFRPAKCGDGRTLYINLVIKNNRNSTNTWICLPYVVTDKAKKHECMFDSPIEIPPYGVVNVTVHTYDSESVCNPLSINEIPQKFGYHIDIGDIFQPLAFEINIPDYLIKGEISANENFDFISIPSDLSNPSDIAKLVLRKKYGEGWYKNYQIGWHYRYPFLPFDHWFVRICPDFSILVTAEKTYFLSPEDFNKFLELYGKNISLQKDEDIIQLLEMYLKLYGMSSSIEDEEIFTENHLELWTEEVKEKYNIDPKNFTSLIINKEGDYWMVDCYTITRMSSHPEIPSPQDVIISHYSVMIGLKGQIQLDLINRTIYKEVISAGSK